MNENSTPARKLMNYFSIFDEAQLTTGSAFIDCVDDFLVFEASKEFYDVGAF